MRKYVVVVREDGVEVRRQVLFVGALVLQPSADGCRYEFVKASVEDMPDVPKA